MSVTATAACIYYINPFPLLGSTVPALIFIAEAIYIVAANRIFPNLSTIEIMLGLRIILLPIIPFSFTQNDSFDLSIYLFAGIALSTIISVAAFQTIDIGLRMRKTSSTVLGATIPRNFSAKYFLQSITFISGSIVMLFFALFVADKRSQSIEEHLARHSTVIFDSVLEDTVARANQILTLVQKNTNQYAIDLQPELHDKKLLADSSISGIYRFEIPISEKAFTLLTIDESDDVKLIRDSTRHLSRGSLQLIVSKKTKALYLIVDDSNEGLLLAIKYRDTESFLKDISSINAAKTAYNSSTSWRIFYSKIPNIVGFENRNDGSVRSGYYNKFAWPFNKQVPNSNIQLIGDIFGDVTHKPSDEIQQKFSTFVDIENMRMTVNEWETLSNSIGILGTEIAIALFILVLLTFGGNIILRPVFPSHSGNLADDELIDEDFSLELLAKPQLISEIEEVRTLVKDKLLEFRKLNRRRQRQLESFDIMLNTMPIGIIGVDRQGESKYINEKLSAILMLHIPAFEALKDFGFELASKTEGAPFELEAGDGTIKFVFVSKINRFDEDGELDGFWLLVVDVTESKRQNEKLAQSSKLATLGKMATEIAHELTQPLNVLRLSHANISKALTTDVIEVERIRSKIIKCNAAVIRAAKVIDHMRSFGRLESRELQYVDIRQAIEGALLLVEDQMAVDSITIVTSVLTEPAMILADINKLEQVILNILSNAKDAIFENRQEAKIWIDLTLEGNKYVIRITDTGGGMTKSDLDNIFLPFYTKKEDGKGTGLGASISHDIIQEFNGRISATNVPGGLQIKIELPITAQESGELLPGTGNGNGNESASENAAPKKKLH